jgi:hypothetical protein
MNRINRFRNLARVVVVGGGLSLFGTFGCIGQTSDQGNASQESDLNRKSHFVGADGTDDQGTGPPVSEHSLGILHSGIQPVLTNEGEGPRPEPWMNLGTNEGPRPEPWTTDGDDDGDGKKPASSSSSSSSGGSSSGGSSSGGSNPVK